MKRILALTKHHCVKRVGIFLITVALIAGMTGCVPETEPDSEPTPSVRYNLTVSSTPGGSVTTPGEGTSTYDVGTEVDLVAEAEEGYQFTEWTGTVGTMADVNAASTTVTMNGQYAITANFAKEIWDWHDLDAIRDSLGGSYVLMNDLDSTTAGYTELASRTANQGKGWQPIGSFLDDPFTHGFVKPIEAFSGNLNGQGYEIGDLFIARRDEDGVGLFSLLGGRGALKNIGVVNAQVSGRFHVGGLVGANKGTVSNSYTSGTVTGERDVGGVVGENFGTVSDSHSIGSIAADWGAGGLVGGNAGILSNSYSSGSVTGGSDVGGLLGRNWGVVSTSYSKCNVTGYILIGGLVGRNWGMVRNSYYDYNEVRVNGQNVISIGALFAGDFEQWLANNMSLDISERLFQQDGYYLVDDVSDFKQLLAFGQDRSLKFKLTADLDLATEPNLYIPYLGGEFDGNGHRIMNLSVNSDFIGHVGVFGYLASGAKVTRVGVEGARITGGWTVGPLAGWNFGIVDNSYATNSMAKGSFVGGLVGWNFWGSVSNSHYNYDEVLINGKNTIAAGALFGADFEEWLANNKSLDVNERFLREDGYYLVNNVSDFKQLLIFGQDDSLKFRLKSDLDLSNDADFYIPYLAGEFNGDGHKISKLTLNFDSVPNVGLFGYLASSAKVTRVGVEDVRITASDYVGGLVGFNDHGIVSDCYSGGTMTGSYRIGGLIGSNDGTVSNSYSTGTVTGDRDVGVLVGLNAGLVSNCYSAGSAAGDQCIGGLVGETGGIVSNSYSISGVAGHHYVGGLVGWNYAGVSNSFWDTGASGQSTSDGGTGKNTTEMQEIATFSGAGWNILAVTPGATNPAYTWNIVDGLTYPFLSWQSVS
jgi:hypothetical protein